MTTPASVPTNGVAAFHPAGPGAGAAAVPGSALLHGVAILARGWRRVAAVALATTAAGALAAAVLPKAYVSGTLLVPFAGTASRSSVALGGVPSGLSNFVAGTIGGGSPAERILNPVLGSSTLTDSIVHRVAHDRNSEEVVRRVLRKGVRVMRNPDGSFVVQVRAPDPQLAATIANTYPVLINKILARVSAEGVLAKAAFLRAQIDSADARLTVSERNLVEFAQRRSAPAAEQQAQRSLDAAAALQQGIFEQEIAVAQLRRTATPNNPELRAAEALLASRRAQLAQLTSGTTPRSVFVPIQRGPELRVASSRVEREYQQDERVYASLSAALTDAQIDASNVLPVLSVLDPAYPPLDPTLTIGDAALLSLGFGTLLGVAVVFFGEVLARMRREPANEPHFEALSRARVLSRTRGPA